MLVLYINLERREDRRRRLEGMLEKYGVSATRVVACTPETPEVKEVIEEHEGIHETLLATGFSHARAWQAVVDSGEPCGLVLEDDVHFHKEWKTMLEKYLGELPEGWELFMLDCIHLNGWDLSTAGITKAEACALADAYVVTAAGAERLLKWHHEHPWKNHETLLIELQSEGNSYTAMPKLALQLSGLASVEHGGKAENSDIQETSTVKAWSKWYRQVYFKRFSMEDYDFS
eukprot:Sspe_Gene.110929::Locus_92069_Transcript_1_1_Confidence_1.000_Length_830::g.110929::m.110929